MLVLFETAAGYAVFKLLKEKKLKKIDELLGDFETPEGANQVLKLVKFKQFKDSVEALSACSATVEGAVSAPLKKLLKNLKIEELHEELAVADTKLASSIKEKFSLECVSNSNIQELMRCIRTQSESLLSGVTKKELSAWELSLAHSMSRYKLKFSPDKVDSMIVQAIKILDELDKKINNNVMTVKGWYGWHFPELEKTITDNMTIVRTILKLGFRKNSTTIDLSDVLPDGLDEKVKKEADMSMGTDITDEDLQQVFNMCEEVVMWTDARAELYDYLRNRMMVIAPNLTLLVGELVGARLIAHAGSMLNLSKNPASTIQILGAEKALFRALKTKHDTPKYGLIYHASLVGQCNPKFKGKVSRMLANKAALAVRLDTMADNNPGTEFAVNALATLQCIVRNLEENSKQKITGSGKKRPHPDKYENTSVVKVVPSADSTLPRSRLSDVVKEPAAKKMKMDPAMSEETEAEPTPSTSEEKQKKKRRRESEVAPETPGKAEEHQIHSEESQKKKKKRKLQEEADANASSETPMKVEEGEESQKKKKKKKQHEGEVVEFKLETPVKVEPTTEGEESQKKKKKKKHQDGDIKSEVIETPGRAEEPTTEGKESHKKKKKNKGGDDA